MGRPPCCDKLGVKKGPWTPEEDIMLVSYVQEHGPANWRAVPTNTGLRRCSKSCRLRWTNYLRPGIRRGDFTPDEEKMIIQLQDLLGNKWAAIASYLPERTDNDIKNYWNTHLKKKLKRLQTATTSEHDGSGLACLSKDVDHEPISSSSHSIFRGQWERRLQTDIHLAKQALNDALSLDQKPIIPAPPSKLTQSQAASCSTTPYASSTENIARLLKGWIKKSPQTMSCSSTTTSDQHSFNKIITDSTSSEGTESQNNGGIDLSEAFESLFGFDYSLESNSNISSDFSTKSNNNNNNNNNMSPEEASTTLFQGESKPDPSSLVPFSMFENWLLDEGAAAVCSWES